MDDQSQGLQAIMNWLKWKPTGNHRFYDHYDQISQTQGYLACNSLQILNVLLNRCRELVMQPTRHKLIARARHNQLNSETTQEREFWVHKAHGPVDLMDYGDEMF